MNDQPETLQMHNQKHNNHKPARYSKNTDKRTGFRHRSETLDATRLGGNHLSESLGG